MIFTREESQTASTPRHEMEVTIRLGAMKDGRIRAIDLYTLSNTGAYGEHGPTTVGLSGHKSIPMYGSLEAYRFAYDVVYSNVMSAGAYRGYGATQGIFAVESAVSEMAARLGIDPIRIREQNMVREGQFMPAYYGETANSCALDQCVERAKEMIGWDEKYPCRDMGNGKVRSVGIAMAMQGSCISNLDVGSATIKVNDDGGYTMLIAAADMEPAAIRFCPRWRQSVWSVMWMTLPLSAQIPIRPRMTPVPMHRVRRILPEKRWKKPA